jgi:hypothetical protein
MFITNRGANYTQQSPSEANSSSASQEIPYILWNPKFRSWARLTQSMLSRPTCLTSIKITQHNKILIMKDKHSTDLWPKIFYKVFIRALPYVRQFDAGLPLGSALSISIWNLRCLKQQWIMYFCSSRFLLLVAILSQLHRHQAAHKPSPHSLSYRHPLWPQHLTDYRVWTFLMSHVWSHFTSYVKGYERRPDTIHHNKKNN